jgi:hypothetical protein
VSENSEPQSGELPSSKAVLADYLARCQGAVALCLKRADEFDDPDQIVAAARLIRASIDLVAAIDGKPPTTHVSRIEHAPSGT